MTEPSRSPLSNDLPPKDSKRAALGARHGIELVLAGDAGRARDFLLGLLRDKGWTVRENSPWSGNATKGNVVLNILLGAFAQYHKIGYAITVKSDQATVVRVHRAAAGVIGGLWGMQKVRRQFDAQAAIIREHLESRFTSVTGQATSGGTD